MKRFLVAMTALCASSAAMAGDYTHARNFVGEVRNREAVRTITMPRPIAAISEARLQGAAGEAQCQGEGTRTLIMRYKATGLVGRSYDADLSCKVTLAQR